LVDIHGIIVILKIGTRASALMGINAP
jgi:hypothetical protein